jgi:hypothetical protein
LGDEMKIETKFNPEDFVFILHRNEIIQAKIKTIKMNITFDDTQIEYQISVPNRKTTLLMSESSIYKDVETVLEDLKNNIVRN